MADDQVRIEIGFEGGQFLRALIGADDADRLERHLKSGGDGVVDLADEEGQLTIVLSHVLYLKRFAKESSIGFSG